MELIKREVLEERIKIIEDVFHQKNQKMNKVLKYLRILFSNYRTQPIFKKQKEKHLMIREKETLEPYLIILLYLLSKKEIKEELLKQISKNKQMRDLHKQHQLLQEILINMKIEVKLKLERFYNKFKSLKTNLIKKEDQGIILYNKIWEESAESMTEQIDSEINRFSDQLLIEKKLEKKLKEVRFFIIIKFKIKLPVFIRNHQEKYLLVCYAILQYMINNNQMFTPQQIYLQKIMKEDIEYLNPILNEYQQEYVNRQIKYLFDHHNHYAVIRHFKQVYKFSDDIFEYYHYIMDTNLDKKAAPVLQILIDRFNEIHKERLVLNYHKLKFFLHCLRQYKGLVVYTGKDYPEFSEIIQECLQNTSQEQLQK